MFCCMFFIINCIYCMNITQWNLMIH
uniref:Uncharacterized protein n=1 Tax=Rhizophora mucronata TaxID=61149 RepID=A0A2P2IUN1_RHIMU